MANAMAVDIESLPPRIRAFIAIRVSDEVEAAVARFVESIRSEGDGISWTRRDKLHVTLKFLGAAVDSSRLTALADALAQVTAARTRIEVQTRGAGAFPNLRRPRVLWVGLDGNGLAELAKEIHDAEVSAAFAPSDRPWTPHLTIGRIRDPRKSRNAVRLVEEASDRDFGQSSISELALYRSHLSRRGSIYEMLASFPLGGAETKNTR